MLREAMEAPRVAVPGPDGLEAGPSDLPEIYRKNTEKKTP